MTFERRPIFPKNVGKNYQSDFSTRETFDMFSMAQCSRQGGEICLKSISIAVNHCVVLLRFVLIGVA